eukprot:jgi/Botrbrau1/6348/Bobra.0098s0007.1
MELGPLDGIRAVACIAIVVGHCMFLQGYTHPSRYKDWYAALEDHPWVLIFTNLSEPALDTMLVLSGFLAARTLIPMITSTPSTVQVVTRYWKGRARRLLPSYYATLAFVAFVFLPLLQGAPLSQGAHLPKEAVTAVSTLWFNIQDACPRLLWVNALFLNNQISRAGCMAYAWSQAVQVQFFIVLPLVLLMLDRCCGGNKTDAGQARRQLEERVQIAALVGLAIASLYRTRVTLTYELPVPVFGPFDDDRVVERVSHIMDTTYIAFTPRLSHLTIGVLAFTVVSRPACGTWFESHGSWATTIALFALTLVTCPLLGNRFGPEPDPNHPLADPVARVVLAVGLTGILQPIALAYLIVFAVTCPTQSYLNRFLTWGPLVKIASVSYDLYLLHPMVLLAVWTYFPPDTWFHLPNPSPWAFFWVSCVVLLWSLVAALAHSLFWDKVLDVWGQCGSAQHQRFFCKGQAGLKKLLMVHDMLLKTLRSSFKTDECKVKSKLQAMWEDSMHLENREMGGMVY